MLPAPSQRGPGEDHVGPLRDDPANGVPSTRTPAHQSQTSPVLFLAAQVKQQVESQMCAACPYPHNPHNPLTFFSRARAARSATSRTPRSPSRRPTTRRGTTCAPSSWPRPRAASRRASRPSSRPVCSHPATTLPPPCHHPASPHHYLCKSSGRREPRRAQGGLPAGGARHRALHRPRGAHLLRVGRRLVQLPLELDARKARVAFACARTRRG